MASYSFVSVWRVEASLESVGLAIADVEHWPDWWKAVKSVTQIKSSKHPLKIGAVYRHVWKSPIPYSIKFDIELVEVIPFKKLRGLATGDLVGDGTWFLEHKDGLTTATYEWNVRTTKLWMNLMAPIARPIFHWGHDWVMKQGELGLKKALARPAHHLAAEPK